MTEYGWYFEGVGVIEGRSHDLWELIEWAVKEASERGLLRELRVGVLHQAMVSDYINSEDVEELSVAVDDSRDTDTRPITAIDILGFVDDAHSNSVTVGTAYLRARASIEFPSDTACAQDVVDWACSNISLDPETVCNGRYPLPIEWIEGEWVFGSKSDKMEDAVITPMLRMVPAGGIDIWYWRAHDRRGLASSLKNAMRAADAVLQNTHP